MYNLDLQVEVDFENVSLFHSSDVSSQFHEIPSLRFAVEAQQIHVQV